MLVYRICDKKEIMDILNNRSLDNVAKYFNDNIKLNTHQYKHDKKYLHFFGEYGDVFYFDSKERQYICTYDIPKKILDKCWGKGYYLERIMLEDMQIVDEYAVESNLINFNNLIQIDMITDTIFYEEYLDNEYKDRIATIYMREDFIKDDSKGKGYLKKK